MKTQRLLEGFLFGEGMEFGAKVSGFKAPAYGAVFGRSGQVTTVFLINSEKYTPRALENENNFSWLCGAGQIMEPKEPMCSGAHIVNWIVANPKYPGAGSACYALLSLYGNNFLTSDRFVSTSPAAQKTWAGIEQSPEWEKAPLDNFSSEKDPLNSRAADTKWFRFSGRYPRRRRKESPTPLTPSDTSDDCPLPLKDSSKLGTADAWRYVGTSINLASLRRQGSVLLEEMEAEGDITKQEQQVAIAKAGEFLFGRKY